MRDVFGVGVVFTLAALVLVAAVVRSPAGAAVEDMVGDEAVLAEVA